MLSWGLLKIFAKYLHLWKKKTIYFYDFDRHEGAFYVHITVRDKSILYEKKCSIVELFAKKNPQEKGKPWTFGCHIRLTSTRFCWCWPTWNQSKTQLCTGQNFWKLFRNYSNIGRYIFLLSDWKKNWSLIDHYLDFFLGEPISRGIGVEM